MKKMKNWWNYQNHGVQLHHPGPDPLLPQKVWVTLTRTMTDMNSTVTSLPAQQLDMTSTVTNIAAQQTEMAARQTDMAQRQEESVEKTETENYK